MREILAVESLHASDEYGLTPYEVLVKHDHCTIDRICISAETAEDARLLVSSLPAQHYEALKGLQNNEERPIH